MKKFNVYVSAEGNYRAVKRGWCWPGFFFTFLWAVFNGMWLVGGGVLAAYLALSCLGRFLGGGGEIALMTAANLVTLAMMFALGRRGNEWREADLASKGFRLEGAAQAAHGEEAIELVTARRHAAPEPPARS